jgi:hypothetical protein
VVATSWAALDADQAVSDDAGMWLRLEEHLGLRTFSVHQGTTPPCGVNNC